MKAALILGAGFSKNSSIPIQSEIPGMLVNNGYEGEFEAAVSEVLKKFMEEVFNYDGSQNMPNLDDILTCLDISTNSGHHLGIKYSPVHLRTIRRLLVYRVFTILEKSFTPSKDVSTLVHKLSKTYETSYIVLNWDTVLEKYIRMVLPGAGVDYCSGGYDWENDGLSKDKVKVIKVHGSCNWLYCDNCRALFHDQNDSFSLLEKGGFQNIDFELFDELRKVSGKEKILSGKKCRICGNIVSSHIATFSYRKSFRANSFPRIWEKAEEVLADSDRWIFIGYSLPEADYEFKHLLKIAELKLRHMRKKDLLIDVVLLNSSSTPQKYKGFFGKRINVLCNDGIKGYLSYI
jgi:NAD-dependent SIR2 family protein deacetylase